MRSNASARPPAGHRPTFREKLGRFCCPCRHRPRRNPQIVYVTAAERPATATSPSGRRSHSPSDMGGPATPSASPVEFYFGSRVFVSKDPRRSPVPFGGWVDGLDSSAPHRSPRSPSPSLAETGRTATFYRTAEITSVSQAESMIRTERGSMANRNRALEYIWMHSPEPTKKFLRLFLFGGNPPATKQKIAELIVLNINNDETLTDPFTKIRILKYLWTLGNGDGIAVASDRESIQRIRDTLLRIEEAIPGRSLFVFPREIAEIARLRTELKQEIHTFCGMSMP